MTLVIRTESNLTDPLPDTPILVDLTSDLRWDLNAGSLSGVIGEGQTIDSWVATGPAPADDRIFDQTVGDRLKPIFRTSGGPGGAPWAEFDGSMHIRNIRNRDPSEQPITFAFVAKVDDWTTSAAARIWSGTAVSIMNIEPTSGGIQLRAGETYTSTLAPSGWFACVVVFNGSNSILGVSGNPLVTGINPGSNRYDGGGLGASTLLVPSSGMIGGIARVQRYARALSPMEVESKLFELEEIYGL